MARFRSEGDVLRKAGWRRKKATTIGGFQRFTFTRELAGEWQEEAEEAEESEELEDEAE